MNFCVGNAKGGVGKTTVTTNLSAALATNQEKYRVCAVDFDFQHNLTRNLIPKGAEINATMYDILAKADGLTMEDCIHKTVHPRLDLIPSEIALSGLEIPLYQDYPDSNLIFRNFAREYLIKNYDFVLFDVGPNINIFLNQALCAADGIIVVTEVGSSDSVANVQAVVKHVEGLKKKHNPDLKFIKLAMNKLNKSRKIDKKNVIEIRGAYTTENCFETIIPVSTDFQGAEDEKHTTIFKYRPSSKGATAFRNLGKEVISEYLPYAFASM